MKAISRILFPVDLSEVSSKLAPDAIAFAKKFDAEVHLLLVTGSFEKFKTFYIPHPSLQTFGDEVLRGGRKKLVEYVEESFADFPKLKTAVVQGDPAEEILKYIEAEKIDLVIMGTHGRKGLDRILFGSVANEVVRHSPAPVLTISQHNPYRMGCRREEPLGQKANLYPVCYHPGGTSDSLIIISSHKVTRREIIFVPSLTFRAIQIRGKRKNVHFDPKAVLALSFMHNLWQEKAARNSRDLLDWADRRRMHARLKRKENGNAPLDAPHASL